jgi:arylsulfatase A-like enzyme
LKRNGAWENTLLVITSDHGEEFFEHGVLGHGFSLYQEVVRVPLIVRGPGVDKGRVVKSPVAIVDLDATILDLAGLGKTAFNDGKSFRPALAAPAWSRGADFYLENEFGENDADLRSFVLSAVRDGSWKLILNEVNAYRPPENPKYGQFELYDLAADAGELKNLFLEAKKIEGLDARVADMVERLRAHSQFLQTTGFRHIPPAALTPEAEAGLRGHGYLKTIKPVK